ncbi:MAG TPA: hypothetical protein VL443_11465 [Cyclobacteriaceae bacterium]|jgi:hypothetical protein|nr:hypothetical protein [Cyclobacteriaceae bacterium]
MLPYFQKDFLIIYYDEVNRIVVSKWEIPPASQEFRNGMDVLIEALIHFNTGKVIFDTVYLGALLDSDQTWISRNWYERAVRAGYSQVAFVIPQEVFTQMFVIEAVNQTINRIPTAYFHNMKEAIDWINLV